MILSISLDGYRFFFRMNVSDAMSSLNACPQVLQILRVLSTRVLTSPVLYENEVKLKKHVNKPVNVFLRNTLVTTVGPVLSTYISRKGSLLSDSFHCESYVGMTGVDEIKKIVGKQTPYETNKKCHPRTVDRKEFPTGKCLATSFHGGP